MWSVDCQTGQWDDGDAIWELNTDGTVNDHWSGQIKDASWTMTQAGRLRISTKSFPAGVFFVREADLSDDCSMLINGTSFTTDAPGVILSCWKAERRW